MDRQEKRQPTELTVKQAAYVQALAEGKSLAQAAEAAGITERTGRHWRASPLVQRALQEARGQALKDVTTRAVSRMAPALDVLTMVMADKGMPPGVRVSAARTILESALRFIETDDILTRLEQVEERLKDAQS